MVRFKNSLILSLFSLIFILASCSTPTESSRGNLMGVISLENQQDHSGITIALYDLAYLDTTIVRINNQYPQIGVHINQHTEFDHRLQSPIKSTETLADGSFEIKKIPTGIYNIVAMKAGFGFKYLYEIEIADGDNEVSQARCHPEFIEGRSELSELSLTHPSVPSLKKEGKLKTNCLSESRKLSGSQRHSTTCHVEVPLSGRSRKSLSRSDADITLYEEHHISGNIQEDIVVASDHHLIIDDDTDFVPGTSLTIHSGAIIRINPGVDLTIHGNLLAQGEENNMFWVTSNDGFDSSLLLTTYSPREELSLYNSFELSEICNIENDLITWGKFDYANTCLLNYVNNLHMQNGIFRNAGCGLKSEDVDSTFCENLFIGKVNNESLGALNYLNNINGNINNNIIQGCTIGIKTKDDCDPEIKNNYIIQCDLGLELLKSNSVVHNNEIINCIYGIKIAGTTTPLINHNIFDNDIAIYIGGYTWYYPNSQPEIHQNNIKSISYYFYLTYLNSFDINAENNYYYTINDEEIQNLIFDKNDVEQSQQEDYGIVVYNPFLNQIVQNAGVE